jgi:predicted site-specific integrase-resolvase
VLIGELAERTGVSQRSLRYYEQQGLLSAERDAYGYRRYGPDSVRAVARIRALLAAGLSTECPDLVRTIRRELAEMDARIGQLQCSRSTLAGYLPG